MHRLSSLLPISVALAGAAVAGPLGCAKSDATGLDVDLLLDTPVLAKVATVRLVLDAEGGFREGSSSYSGGTVTTATSNEDADPDLETVVTFSGGYRFQPVLEFVAVLGNRKQLEVDLHAVALDSAGARIGSGTAKQTSVPGSLRSVSLAVTCDRDGCTPPPAKPDGGGPDGGGPDAGGDGTGGPAIATLDLAKEPPSLKLLGARAGDRLSVLAACDLDGDGTGDLVVAAPTAQDSLGNQAIGAVYVVFGRDFATAGAKTSFDFAKGEQGFRITGGAAGDRLGAAVACGDTDGDHADDLLVAAPNADGLSGESAAGRVYLVLGRAALRGQSIDLAAGNPVSAWWSGGAAGEQAGSALAVADLNGDGKADIAIASPGQSATGRSGGGVVHVLPGRASWPAGGQTLSLPATDHAAIAGGDGWKLAASLAAGDLDGNGKADLVLGAPEAKRTGDSSPRGAAFVFGAIAPATAKAWDAASVATADAPSLLVWGPAPGSQLGRAVAAADVNKDERADLLAGAPQAGPAGRVFVVLGDSALYAPQGSTPASRDTSAGGAGGYSAVFTGEAAGDNFGSALGATTSGSSATADLLVGAPGGPADRAGAGMVYRLKPRSFGAGQEIDLGNATTAAAAIVLRLVGAASSDALGTAVAGGRFNSEDVLGDQLAAAPGATGAAAGSGVAYGVLGK